jgi:putative transposase
MRRKRFSPEQIIKILKKAQVGFKIIYMCRKYGISEQTLYNWRNKYDSMEISDVRKLKALEEENGKLKRLVADLRLDNQVVKDLLEKNC